jgi:glutathione S-transferase
MMILYSAPATAGMVVHWLLLDLDLPHELRLLDTEKKEQKSPEYLRLNPAGVVPTLVIDGHPLTEAAAITMHLADITPRAALAPAAGTMARARYTQWMFYMANTLQPAYRAWFYPTEPAGEAHVADVKEHARARIEAAWDQVAADLSVNGPFVLGKDLSAADFMMTMLMRWSRNMPRPAHTWPVLADHARAMKARPSFREMYAREGLTEWP